MKKVVFMVLAFFCTMVAANAMKTKVDGDLKCLKGVESVNLKFTYNNMIVGKMTEQAYIDKKVSEYNAKKEGRGDEWFNLWETDKAKVYPVHFTELFEKYSKIKSNNLSEEKITIEINTDFFEPGFNIGIASQNALISVTIKIYETANPEAILAQVVIIKSPGRTFSGTDFTVSDRVGEAYAKAGKEFGSVVKKAIK